MAYRIESDDQDQEIRDLMNRVSDLEEQLAQAQKPDASKNTLPIDIVIQRSELLAFLVWYRKHTELHSWSVDVAVQ